MTVASQRESKIRRFKKRKDGEDLNGSGEVAATNCFQVPDLRISDCKRST
jgi:hypothetical protein